MAATATYVYVHEGRDEAILHTEVIAPFRVCFVSAGGVSSGWHGQVVVDVVRSLLARARGHVRMTLCRWRYSGDIRVLAHDTAFFSVDGGESFRCTGCSCGVTHRAQLIRIPPSPTRPCPINPPPLAIENNASNSGDDDYIVVDICCGY